jgi:hypothetical protein
MAINMEEAKLRTLEQVKAFLDGTSEVAFRVPKEDRNPFIERVLKRFGYAPRGRADKGVLLRYIDVWHTNTRAIPGMPCIFPLSIRSRPHKHKQNGALH